MKTSDFYFDLPPERIAQYPLEARSGSKMLVYNKATGAIQHEQFIHLPQHLHEGDLLVFNNSKVIPARLFGHKATGGKIELLVERVLSSFHFLAHIRASKTPKPGAIICLSEEIEVKVIEKKDHLYECSSTAPLELILERLGHIPLPPYIQRQADAADKQRYQTVYAHKPGSVAAPTAGLHFDEDMLTRLKEKNIEVAFTTLHVGAGTFQPVRTAEIADHQMHAEWLEVSSSLCATINEAKSQGRRIIAVGSTSLRALESAAKDKQLHPYSGETSIFITPGYEFQIVDGLMTNFHLPESTLLMMVAAFIGYNEMMQLYQTAIQQDYRFFSYGDVSLLT